MVRPLLKGNQGFVPWWLVCSVQKGRFAPIPRDRRFPCAVAVRGRVAHSKRCARHTFIYLLVKEGSMLLVRFVITEHPNVCLFSFMRDPGSVIDCH